MLDKIDKKLILELQADGRQTFARLAPKLNVNEVTVRRRLTRLTEKNIISITAMPDLDALGYKFSAIVGIEAESRDLYSLAEQIASHANVYYLSQATGRYDFMTIILAKNPSDFGHFLDNVIRKIPGVVRTETFVNLFIHKKQATPLDTIHLVSECDS